MRVAEETQAGRLHERQDDPQCQTLTAGAFTGIAQRAVSGTPHRSVLRPWKIR